MDYIDEMAPLTQEQWECLVAYYRAKYAPVAPALIVALQFQGSMEQIQRNAGCSQGQFREVSQALLDMVQGDEETL